MILAVASGKGGTGKTLVATSLALSLVEQGDVQLLDCDVEEPNAHLFLDPTITHTERVTTPVPKVDEEKCTHCGVCSEICAYHAILSIESKVLLFPELCHGCGACGYLCPEEVITEDENVVKTAYEKIWVMTKSDDVESLNPVDLRELKGLVSRGDSAGLRKFAARCIPENCFKPAAPPLTDVTEEDDASATKRERAPARGVRPAAVESY